MSKSKIVPFGSFSREQLIKQLAFCIIDKVANVIVSLFCAQNRADAKRAYLNMLKKTPNVNTDDFVLSEISNLNDNLEILDLSKIDYAPLANLAPLPNKEV